VEGLNVGDLCAPDAALFLWTTWPMILDALGLMVEWGFSYKTVGFVWVKQSSTGRKMHWGMGNWTRANSEVCLLGVRGKIRRVDKGVHQIVEAPVTKHSQKPAEVREKIATLMGDVLGIEMFARGTAPGWDCWGLDVNAGLTIERWSPEVGDRNDGKHGRDGTHG
jgi:N6-adenosine-specific RNA methylase IME4